MSNNEEENIMLKVAEERARNYSSIPQNNNFNTDSNTNNYNNPKFKENKETSDSIYCFTFCTLLMVGIILGMIYIYK
jgi:hypothetical protein